MKKCPPGVICIENYSMFFVVMCLFVLLYLVYKSSVPSSLSSSPPERVQPENKIVISPYWTSSSDPLLNPYAPPLRNTSAMPINVSTNVGAVDASYRQVGIMTPMNTKNNVVPLMGRPLFTNRDKWQYYSMNGNNVKLPISRNGKSCTNEYGCDQLFNGDTVYVEGLNEAYRVTVYDNDTMRYLPML